MRVTSVGGRLTNKLRSQPQYPGAMDIVETEVRTGTVVGTLAEYAGIELELAPRILFILHGLGGHRDYCYQRQLGQELPGKRRICTFRFDFRNCGSSDPVPDPKLGRSIKGTDFEDITEVYNYFCRDRTYEFLGFVAHSRASTAAQTWILANQNRINVPYMINCSGRFNTPLYLEKTEKNYERFKEDDGYLLTAKRYGKYEPQWIARSEVEDFAAQDTTRFAAINKVTFVFTIFGSADRHVPIEDAAFWANMYSGRHELQIIMDADHNFFGTRDGKKVSYNPKVVDLICNFFEPTVEVARFYRTNLNAGEIPRWVEVDGVRNFRDFGGYENVRPGILFRSAGIGGITSQGIQKLQALGVKRVYDLRSDIEAAKDGPVFMSGIEVIRIPVFKERDLSPAALAERYASLTTKSAFPKAYMEMLDNCGHVLRRIMLTLRDFPGEGVVIHCTAGKDRTGVVCAAILLLLSVDKYTVCQDYTLTAIGLKEQLEVMAAVLTSKLEHLGVTQYQVDEILSAQFDAMSGTIQLLLERYKTIDGYFRQICGLTNRDINRIRANLEKNVTAHSHL